jgi:hypothetical protein
VIKKLLLMVAVALFSNACLSQSESVQQFPHPYYVGILGGYGSTTWEGLVPKQAKQNIAMMMSTPVRVKEGGGVWGLLIGYELTPWFALESNYIHYPPARVSFDSSSIFSFEHHDRRGFYTHTETVNLMGKVMLMLPKPGWRLFSSAGIAGLHREDTLYEKWRLVPTFGVGLNVNLSERLMAELAGNYTAGYGESQLNPTETYFPFLYSLSVRLAYRFG